MKKLLGILAGVLFYAITALVLTGYDNMTMHKLANDQIVGYFIAVINDNPNKFKDYEFDFTRKLEGIGIGEVSNTKRINSSMALSVRDWIIHGGFSCDEPEGWQSLRHFYDPKKNSGYHYLTDITNKQAFLTWAASLGGTGNPEIDAIEWALEDNGDIQRGLDQLEQLYSWKDGKKYFENAITNPDEKLKETNLADAWRSFGEVLHLYMDMACPAHVRNDGHPPYFTNIDRTLINFWGDPDPYETYATSHHLDRKIDVSVENKISKAKTVREIFNILAEYTNENFFTNQTIYGNVNGQTIYPVIRKDNPYSLPYLEENKNGWVYDASKYTYTKKIGGFDILMCKDLHRGYFSSSRGYPIIDRECSWSQASILVYTAAFSGQHLFSKYIPRLKVNLFEATAGKVKGTIEHETNDEYPNKLTYKGKILLQDVATKSIIEGNVTSSSFEINSQEIKSNARYVALIDLMGIKIKSNEIGAKEEEKKFVKLSFGFDVACNVREKCDWGNDTIVVRTVSPGFNNAPNIIVTQQGKRINANWNYSEDSEWIKNSYSGTAIIDINADNSITVAIEGRKEIFDKTFQKNSYEQNYSLNTKAIPFWRENSIIKTWEYRVSPKSYISSFYSKWSQNNGQCDYEYVGLRNDEPTSFIFIELTYE